MCSDEDHQVLHKPEESVSAEVQTVIKAKTGQTKYSEIHVNIYSVPPLTQVAADIIIYNENLCVKLKKNGKEKHFHCSQTGAHSI